MPDKIVTLSDLDDGDVFLCAGVKQPYSAIKTVCGTNGSLGYVYIRGPKAGQHFSCDGSMKVRKAGGVRQLFLTTP